MVVVKPSSHFKNYLTHDRNRAICLRTFFKNIEDKIWKKKLTFKFWRNTDITQIFLCKGRILTKHKNILHFKVKFNIPWWYFELWRPWIPPKLWGGLNRLTFQYRKTKIAKRQNDQCLTLATPKLILILDSTSFTHNKQEEVQHSSYKSFRNITRLPNISQAKTFGGARAVNGSTKRPLASGGAGSFWAPHSQVREPPST